LTYKLGGYLHHAILNRALVPATLLHLLILFIFILDLTLPSSRLGPWHTEGWQRATDTPTDTVTPRGGRKGRDDDIPTPEAA